MFWYFGCLVLCLFVVVSGLVIWAGSSVFVGWCNMQMLVLFASWLGFVFWCFGWLVGWYGIVLGLVGLL